jgi:hypothetical protein
VIDRIDAVTSHAEQVAAQMAAGGSRPPDLCAEPDDHGRMARVAHVPPCGARA